MGFAMKHDSFPQIMADVKSHLPSAMSSWFWLDSIKIFGRGPNNLQPGDRLCVVEQCSTPIVLREVDGHYIHVGPAFAYPLFDEEKTGRFLTKLGREPRWFEVW